MAVVNCWILCSTKWFYPKLLLNLLLLLGIERSRCWSFYIFNVSSSSPHWVWYKTDWIKYEPKGVYRFCLLKRPFRKENNVFIFLWREKILQYFLIPLSLGVIYVRWSAVKARIVEDIPSSYNSENILYFFLRIFSPQRKLQVVIGTSVEIDSDATFNNSKANPCNL